VFNLSGGCLTSSFAYRDKKVVSVFVRFRAPLHPCCKSLRKQGGDKVITFWLQLSLYISFGYRSAI
jgi:hypothetical protein